jgi:hypothetical protein
MIQLVYKTSRIRKEAESGNLDLKLGKILEWAMMWISFEYPKYSELTITDIFRLQKEQDKIYLNHINPDTVKRYKKKPWYSVHQDWRGVDIRTNDMPKGMAVRLVKLLNMITYDSTRTYIVTAKYHDVSKKQNAGHIHLQVVYN